METGVVVVTRNRRATLLETLRHLEALPERPPLCVVDNASTDGTASAVSAEHPRVKLVRLARNEGTGARNAGAAALGTPLIAFCDDDSWWEDGALTVAGDAFRRHPRLGLLGACVLVGRDRALDPTCAAMAASPLSAAGPLPGPPVLGFVACGAVVRRAALDAVGGFERRFGTGGEEQLLALDLAAAGWDLAYMPEVRAFHHPAATGPRPARRRRQLRNELWATWLRRPMRPALRATARILSRPGQPRLSGLAGALRGLPWVIRERRAVPAALEERIAALERAPGGQDSPPSTVCPDGPTTYHSAPN